MGRWSLVKVATMFFKNLSSVSLNHFKSFCGGFKPAPSKGKEDASKKAPSIMRFSILRLSTTVHDTQCCYACCCITKKQWMV